PPVMIAVFPSRENGDVVMAGTIPQPAAGSRAGLLRQRDLGLAPRNLALDPTPDRGRRERCAVRLRARGQLVHELTQLVALTPRSLRRATHIVVAGPLRLDPRLFQMRHQQHEAIGLGIDVRIPRLKGGTAPTALLAQ